LDELLLKKEEKLKVGYPIILSSSSLEECSGSCGLFMESVKLEST